MSVYKSEKPAYLERALKSIWDDQSLKPDKIVLVQDGPVGDELVYVIKNWSNRLNEKFCLIVNQNNIGLTKSLNKGIAQISTDYIARMDSDDIALPLRFEKQKSFLDENPDISVVGSYIQEFNDICPNLGIREYPKDTEAAKRMIYRANPLAHPAVMIRKKIFDEGISYDERYRTSQDLALWFDILCAEYKLANIEDILLLFRRNVNVYKRRTNKNDSIIELKVHERGIYNLYGFSPFKSLFPLFRFLIRLLPYSLINILYNSKLRKMIAK